MRFVRLTAILALILCVALLAVSCGDLDKNELGELLQREYDPNGYTDASYQNYLKFYQQAQDVYASDSTTAYRIEAATVNLLKAIDDLVPIADFSELLLELEEEINPMLYTSASYQVYKTVYDSAVIVCSNELSKQSVVNNALRNLRMAKKSLVHKTDTSELAQLLEQSANYDRSQYTLTSYNKYLESYHSAKALLYDDSVAESDLRLAINGLKQAIAGLTPLGNTDELAALIYDLEVQYLSDTGNFTPEERYTVATLEVLKNELAAAKNAIMQNDASSHDVERMMEKLITTAANVVDKIELHEAILRMDGYLAIKNKYTADSFDAYILEITKAMVINDKHAPSKEEIRAAVDAIIDAENMLVRKSLTASGRTDFDLASMTIDCYGIKTTLAAYFISYVDFYAALFDSPYMYEQSSFSEFTMKDGYRLTLLPASLSVTMEQAQRSDVMKILGVDFTMDEYEVVELLGAPTEFNSDGTRVRMAYQDAAFGLYCEMQFVGGTLESVVISK